MTSFVFAALLLVAGTAAASKHEQPLVFLHLSDLHMSVNAKALWRSYGDRVGDLELFSAKLLPHLRPAAVIITGDLTDSKDAAGAGHQYESEWQAYSDVLLTLQAAGVPADRILDVRGNHDGFNRAAQRGTANDLFSTYSAWGRSGQGAQRAVTHMLRPLSMPWNPANSTNAAAAQSGAVHFRGLRSAGSPPACPAAVLLGIDVAADPALRNPINFLASADAGLLEEVQQRAAAALHEWPPYCPSPPPLLAFGHYPLSVVDFDGRGSTWGPAGAPLHALHSMHSMQGLAATLAHLNASCYLSGHLHTVFGERLHRMHRIQSSAAHGLSKEEDTDEDRYLAELESAAWKDDRRFRIAAVDGGALSFLDLYLHTLSSPTMPGRGDAAARHDSSWLQAYERRGWWGVTATEPTATVLHHIALLTWPPDARYSPQPAMRVDVHAEGAVRAVIFPLEEAAAVEHGAGVEMDVFLPDGSRLMHADLRVADQSPANKAKAEGGRLFEAAPRVTVYCAAARGVDGAREAVACVPPAEFVHVQVSVRGGGALRDARSTSPRVPVSLGCRPLGTGSQECWLQPNVGTPTPLGSTAVEWVTLAVNWPALLHRVYLLLWALHVGVLLLLPRRLHRNAALVRRILVSPLFRAPVLVSAGSDAALSPSKLLPMHGRVLLGQGLLRRVVDGLSGEVLWPLAALVLVAGVDAVWYPLVGYAVYSLLGPLCLADMMSGCPLAVVFHYGVLGKFIGGAPSEVPRWQVVGNADTLQFAIPHLVTCVLPCTLWVACVTGHRLLHPSAFGAGEGGGHRRSASADGGSAAKSPAAGLLSSVWMGGVTPLQAAALAAILAFNWFVVYSKSWHCLGAVSVLVSPGYAWGIPLAVLLVAAAPMHLDNVDHSRKGR